MQKDLLLKYAWPGNVRQLKNITEQNFNKLNEERDITLQTLKTYLPEL